MSRKLISLAMALLSLTACDSVKEAVGANRKSLDEFAILQRAPLTLPPDYELRPPQEGAARPQENTSSTDAARALGLPASKSDALVNRSAGEQTLLQKTGAAEADQNIRTTIEKERADFENQQKLPLDEYNPFRKDAANPSDTELDAEAERERLKKQQEELERARKNPELMQ